ncbi:sulfatase [Arthrobacter sp. CDRTa11]|uniref:sulfatase n=1 Tax=Arthrobacter sp. CDRTa11 TaxID=2651199 RepID=UPI0022659705|nr:sulfatase [Arthrobacter sp. CDRTa11]UZX03117.1 sulfatase [Arthrobacter sp. CDRTa11]
MKIIYVDVDSLRPDHTGPYGYQRRITPHLDELAQRSVRFDRYYCSDSPCLPSRTALTSGQFGITNGVVGHAGDAARFRLDSGHRPEPGRPLLGQHLTQNGYLTACVSSFAERHRAYFFTGNFQENIRAAPEIGDEPAEIITDKAVDWIERNKDGENWYLHLTYWDPHVSYLQPPEWTDKAAASGPPPAWPTQEAIDRHAEIYGSRTALDLHYFGGPNPSPVPYNMPDAIRTRADFEHLINGYDGAIHYWDHHFGRLLTAIDTLGIREEVAIVVSADHGEAFGELGAYGEHGLASEPVQRLPLIIHWPGITDTVEAKSNDALLYNIDYAPTLCKLLDLPVPEKWQGESFASAVQGEPMKSREHLVLGHGAHTFQRAVRTRDYLYMRTYHPGAYRAEWESLFHVDQDPYLEHDLIETEPSIAEGMRSRLMAWWSFYAGTPGALPDPMQISLQTGPTLYTDPEEYARHLRDTGREHLAKDLEERLHPANGAVPVSWHASAPIRTIRAKKAEVPD